MTIFYYFYFISYIFYEFTVTYFSLAPLLFIVIRVHCFKFVNSRTLVRLEAFVQEIFHFI